MKDNAELRILGMMNESLQDQVDQDNPDLDVRKIDPTDNIYNDESNKYVTRNSREEVKDLIGQDGKVQCDVCGTIYRVDEDADEDVQECPNCGSLPQSDDPQTFAESILEAYDELCSECEYDEAKELLNKNNATVECDEDGNLVLEAYKIHVDASGKKTKKKVRTKKVRLSAAQKAALRKARKKAHTGKANKLRNKAMKKRRAKGL